MALNGNGFRRGLRIDLTKSLGTEIADRDDIRHEEQVLCKTEADRLKFLIKQQMDLVKKLTDEFAAFNAGFNRRVNYFRILQEISDTVEPVTLETHSVESDMPIVSERISIAEAALDKVNARKRYVSARVQLMLQAQDLLTFGAYVLTARLDPQ